MHLLFFLTDAILLNCIHFGLEGAVAVFIDQILHTVSACHGVLVPTFPTERGLIVFFQNFFHLFPQSSSTFRRKVKLEIEIHRTICIPLSLEKVSIYFWFFSQLQLPWCCVWGGRKFLLLVLLQVYLLVFSSGSELDFVSTFSVCWHEEKISIKSGRVAYLSEVSV